MKSNTTKVIGACLSAAAFVAVQALASAVQAEIRSGSICVEETYTNPFHTDANGVLTPGPDNVPLVGAKAGCAAFHQQLGSTKVFDWYTYNGEHRALENQWVSTWGAQVEDTDITFVVGHGGIFAGDFELDSYYGFERAYSAGMYLGKTGRGLSVLSIASCYSLEPYVLAGHAHPETDPYYLPNFPAIPVHTPAPHDVFYRWSPAVAGGLRMVTGAWNTMPTVGLATLGANYGTYLKTQTVASAWRQAAFDAATGTYPAVFATGTNQTTCAAKISGMTMNNLSNYGRLRDSAVGSYCWQAWW